jgi:hypothetical protein
MPGITIKLAVKLTVNLTLLALLLGYCASAAAAPPFVYRDIVLPRHDVAIDVGLGVGRAPLGPDDSISGWGLNLEFAGGISHNVELGVRTGFRFDNGGRYTQADRYGRTFDTETYGTEHDDMANPELHIRWAIARGTASLGLEGRAYIPVESPDSHFGVMVGLPLTLRLASVRFDTGLYVPMIFYDNTLTGVSIPLHLWIQASNTLWFGPLFGWRHWSSNGGSYTQYPFGFGLGTALTRAIDFRTWFLFPDINRSEGGREFGGGVGFQFRVE